MNQPSASPQLTCEHFYHSVGVDHPVVAYVRVCQFCQHLIPETRKELRRAANQGVRIRERVARWFRRHGVAR